MRRHRSFRVESLEIRQVPASFGYPWADPGNLTLSFAPDGTAIAGHESNLYAALDSQAARAAWQRTLLESFQAWAVHANLNFAWQPDSGAAFGAAGLVQGDPRIGDLRIGAQEMSADVLAISIPPDPALAGTWSGDVLLNSSDLAGGSSVPLKAVVMHEAGNALGLADSEDPATVMYRLYSSGRTQLAAADIARIQALYGVRAADAYEGPRGNQKPRTASEFRLPTGYKGETPLVAFGDVTTPSDVDMYRFSFPQDGNDDANDRSVTIRLQSSGISLLAPKLTIRDASGRVLGRQVSTSITGDTLQLTIAGLSSSQTYYVQVQAGTDSAFGVGRYGLSVRFDKTSGTPDQVIDRLLAGPFSGLSANDVDAFFRTNGDVLLNAGEFQNETPSTATSLTPSPGYSAQTRYEAVGSLAKSEDVDVYRIVAPAGGGSVLTVSVWTPDSNGFQPTVTVLDAAGRPVPSTILVSGQGSTTLQVTGLRPGETCFLRVSLSRQASADKGNYFLSAQFGSRAAELATFAQGELDESNRSEGHRLMIARTQLFQFVLSAGNEDPGASVRMSIRDESGNEVAALTAAAGDTVSLGSILLKPGTYTTHYTINNPSGRRLRFSVGGSSQSDPIGPVVGDTALAPGFTSPENPGKYVYPGFDVPYDPALLPDYVDPQDPATYPEGFVLPPSQTSTWLIVTLSPFVWIPLR